MKGFYELGLPEQFVQNYEQLNRNQKVELFPWQAELLNIGEFFFRKKWSKIKQNRKLAQIGI